MRGLPWFVVNGSPGRKASEAYALGYPCERRGCPARDDDLTPRLITMQRVWSLPAVPRSWLRDGEEIRFDKLSTHFGPVSLKVRSAVADGRIEAHCVPPDRQPPHAVKLRLRHPKSRPIRSVTVNGEAWKSFDRDNEWVVLPKSSAPCHVVVSY